MSDAQAYPLSEAYSVARPALALEEYVSRQKSFSESTFGPGRRTGGVTQHIEKELAEIRSDPSDFTEWIDVIILAIDGYWRHGGDPAELMGLLEAKQRKNIVRKWPAPISEDHAIEHVRTQEEQHAHEVVRLAAQVREEGK